MNWEHTCKPWALLHKHLLNCFFPLSLIRPWPVPCQDSSRCCCWFCWFPRACSCCCSPNRLVPLLFLDLFCPLRLISFPGLRYSYRVICLFSSFFHKVDQSNDGGVSSWLFNWHHHIQEPAGIWQRIRIKSTAVLPDTKGLSVTSCNTL